MCIKDRVDGHPKDADGGAAVFHSCPVPGAVQPVGQAWLLYTF